MNLEQAERLEVPITEREIREVILLMSNGKSPGYDGLPAEYYKEYIDILGPVLLVGISRNI